MNKSEYLSARLREVYIDGRWIANTNYQEQLQNLSWTDAIHHIHGLNSIAVLTFHINYYLEGLMHAFEFNKLEISDRFSFDLPAIQKEEDWIHLRQRFFNNAEKFVRLVSTIPEDKLDDLFIEEKYGSLLRNIEAVVEHSYYHLGQVVLIRKMLNNLNVG